MSAPVPITKPTENTLSLDRTILANERTYQAWIRTGLSLLVAGLGLSKFFSQDLPSGLIIPVSGLLILFSAGSFVLAAWRYRHLHLKVSHLDVDTIPLWIIMGASLLLAASAVLLFAGLFMNGPG